MFDNRDDFQIEMGKKAEKGTPKALANAMKSKGLQKLRFYCQLWKWF